MITANDIYNYVANTVSTFCRIKFELLEGLVSSSTPLRESDVAKHLSAAVNLFASTWEAMLKYSETIRNALKTVSPSSRLCTSTQLAFRRIPKCVWSDLAMVW